MKKREIKLFIVLLLSTAFIFSFSHFGAKAYNALTEDSTGFKKGTTIAQIDVSNKSKAEALALLNEQLQKWRSETKVTIQYKEKSVPLDIAQYQFDLEASVENAKDGHQNDVVVTFKSGDLYQYMKQMSSKLDSSKVDMDPLVSELIMYAANLTPNQYLLKVDKFLSVANNNEVISEAALSPATVPIELGILVEELSPIKIEPQSQISLLQLLEKRKFTTFPSEAASMVGTVIFKTILASNFTIVEKHIGQVLPDYAELGLEAKVDYTNHLDFVFVNPNDLNYEIGLKLVDHTLTATLKGSPFLYNYKVKLSNKQEFKPKTIIQYSPLLSPDEVKIQQSGGNGLMIKVYREVFGENDVWLSNELISEDFYPPIPTIEVRALKSTTNNTGTTDTGTNNTSTTDSTSPTQPAPNTEDDLYGKPNEETK
ncbi:VanW family protein [Neobacillus sp. LXY-4]|uniref:VanW family protein n=1 Tax=Neobacillus sp. LXY-4 TaxID=3379826 RepID=UPI003EE27301